MLVTSLRWKHFSCYWPLVRGIHRSPVDFPRKASDAQFYLVCTGTNGWANNQDACGLGRHRSHYEVIVTEYPLRAQNQRQVLSMHFRHILTWGSFTPSCTFERRAKPTIHRSQEYGIYVWMSDEPSKNIIYNLIFKLPTRPSEYQEKILFRRLEDYIPDPWPIWPRKLTQVKPNRHWNSMAV